METQFERFQKMKIKEACKEMEDMTYAFINPVTKEPTFVPAKHYEQILGKTVELFLDEQIKIEMLNNVYKQLVFLQKEYGNDFLKSLICLDMGIKPTDLSVKEDIALEETFHYIKDDREEHKKNYHFMNNDYVQKYQEALNDKELHASYLGCEYEDKEKNIDDDFEDFEL